MRAEGICKGTQWWNGASVEGKGGFVGRRRAGRNYGGLGVQLC